MGGGTGPKSASVVAPEARRWRIEGQVQGVGFRPFVYRLASELGLRGWVLNRSGQVEVHTEGEPRAQQAFEQELLRRAPPLSRPTIAAVSRVPPGGFDAFRIRASEASARAEIHVPPDCFTCDDCLAELRRPDDRRFRYPFINCTQCGPRYTLIRSLPYDRANTSMAEFELCPACNAEYRDPLDRRFHAEPVACPVCGPQLEFVRPGARPQQRERALSACLQALREGQVVAVKGVGGYHLLCDARNEAAIARLRERKPRPHKPLAVMFPASGGQVPAALAGEVEATEAELQLLRSPLRPIVLLRRAASGSLPGAIAPGLRELGVMLPYSPLHHLLLDDFGAPLVATSANLSGEPVLTDGATVERRLAGVADAFLYHDRPILRPADDPVYRRIAGAPRPLRLGRGCAPLELELPFELERPVLAVGGHTKNSVALAWERRVVLSPHIGDMGSARSLEVFGQVVDDLQSLYGVRAAAVVADAHPGYASTRWAQRCGLPVTGVYHHRAHASALAGEHDIDGDWLVFAWDGVGYGEDGSLWGGEALAGRPGDWQRVASLRSFRLPGGERAGREPWRSALALAWEAGLDWSCPEIGREEQALLYHAWQRGLNAPSSSAAGRLFDAAAALGGVCSRASFEGQGPMLLEALCTEGAEAIELPLQRGRDGVWRSDWEPLVRWLLQAQVDAARKAAVFHASLAAALVRQALVVRRQRGVDRVGLCGGVFQNRVLAEQALAGLEAEGFEVRLNRQVPVNDAGLCFGQVIEYGSIAGR